MFTKIWIKAIIASFVLVLLAACGSSPAVDDKVPEPELITEYRIGPGDSLNIFVWRNPEISILVPVRPDGRVSTPLVEDR